MHSFISSLNVSFRDSPDPSSMTDESSAYCVGMNSLLLIFIPLILLLFFIFIARISAQSINKYWEISLPVYSLVLSKRRRRDFHLEL